jgi:predicted amidohydrolase YtcJ
MHRLVLLALLFCACSSRPSADLLLYGGRIYTFGADDGTPVVEALAIYDGQVIAAGNVAQLQRFVGPRTERVDLAGGVAVPGLVDAHAHIFNLGRLLEIADLRGTTSIEEILTRLQARAQSLPEGVWLRGRGWDQNDWVEKSFPDKSSLDERFGERPVYLERVDGHAGWVNSAALRAASITAATTDPAGGEILRDASGEPTGIVVDAAEELITDVMPPEGAADLDRILAAALDECASHGLTGVHEMGVDAAEWAALQRADAAGTLKLRIVAYLDGADALDAYAGEALRPGPKARLRLSGVKLYADGALGSRGAALLEDYSDRPGHQGLLRSSPEQLTESVRRAVARGFSVAIHAIGDRGNRVALDAIEQGHAAALAANGSIGALRAAHHRVEHVQILHPDDIGRFAQLGVLPSMQPTHCTSDMPWAPERLGPHRLAGAYAWRSLREHGCVLPLGSDFPVEEVSPLYGLYAAVTRRGVDGTPAEGWAPEQALTIQEALLGFGAWASEAAGVPQWGRLRAGDRADITVFDRDPLVVPAQELLQLQIRARLVEGRLDTR